MQDEDGREDLISEARRALKPLLVRIYPALLGLMILLLLAGAASDIDRWQLFVDPAEEQEAVLVGVFSNLGVLLWWSTVTITGLTWFVARRAGSSSEFSKMCGAAALLSAYLALDDFFLLHDYVFPESLHIPEGLALAVTLGAAAFFLVRFRRVLLVSRTRLVLGVALLFLGASVVVDALPGLHGKGTIEDSLKLVGIATWLYYFVTLCAARLRSID